MIPSTVKSVFLGMGQEVLQHLLMHGGIPHHAFFTHLFPAGLELGLDQAGDLTRPAAAAPYSAGKISFREIKDTSMLAKSSGSGICSGVR